MPDEADDFLRKWGGGAPAAPAAAPPDEADAFLSKWGSAPPATPAPAAPAGASDHLASTADFSGKPPVMSGAFRPSLGPPDRGGVSLGEAAKTAAATLGGGILDVGDRYTGKIQEAVETGFEHLPIGGQGAYVPDLSREGLTWEERLRTAGGRQAPRPVSEMADAINRGLGTGAPTVAQTKTALRKDPSVDLGFRGEEAAAPAIGDTALMLTGGGAIQRGLTATKTGTALAGTRAGRGLLGIGAFGGGGVLVDPEHPKEAIVNGALSYVGMKAGEFVAAPFLAGIMSRAEQAARGVNPTFIKALSGIGEGVGQSLAPQVHDGEWRSALLEGDATTVATNLALNAIFTAGAPDIPLGVKQAYIKGRAGEVPPQYRARLDALAGPIYDSARSTAAEAAKAKAGAKPWTAGDEAAARAEIHAQGATGKAAEAQLAKAKRNTYDADLVTPEMLAEGKTGSTGAAADALLGRDRADFAANAQARAEQGLDPKAGLVAGKRETEALEMGEAAAAGQATREAARDSVEPGVPGMLSRPLGEPATAPERAPVPEAPPAAPVAPEPATAPADAPAGARESAPVPASAPEAPALAPIGKTRDGRTVFGKGDKFYVRGTGGRLGAAHPGEVAEARAESEIAPSAPVKEGEVVQRPGSVLDAAERAGIPGAKEARENLDSLPESATRWDPVEKRWTRDPVEPAIEGAFQPPAPKTRAFGRKSAATLEAEATKNAGLAQLVRREGGIDLTGTNLTGEVNGLRLKESGTTGLVAPKGGGRSKSVQRLMDAAREEGFDLDGWSETKFVESVLSDAQGDRTLNPAMVDSDQLAEASVRGRDEAETARWEEEQARQKAPVQAGETVYGITRDGMFAQGTVVRETAKSVIVDTPNGQRSIPKTDVQRPPRGIYMGSGFGGLEGVGPALKGVFPAIGRYSKSFFHWASMRTAPKMARSAPEASQYAGGIVNSHTTSKMVAPVWLERVFGENPSPEAMAKFGHAAGEWQFTAKKKALQAQLDATTDPVARGRIEDKLDRVGTVVGAEGSPFATQADLDAYMATPEWKQQSEAWREMWNKAEVVDGADLPGPERMYTDLAKKGDSDPELFTSDDRDVLRVNMKPMEPDAEGGTRPVYRTATGSLRAPILKGHAFSREFSGGAAKYDFDPGALIENTYQRVHAEWLKPQMYDALVRAGDAVYTNTKDPDWKPPTKIKGEDVARFTIVEPRTILKDGKAIHVPGKTLYVKESLQGELNQTLRTAPAAKQVLPIRVINTAALTGIADNMWNLMLDAQIPASAPGHIKGRVGNQLGLANNIVGLLKQIKYTIRRPKDYNARALRLAADASWRGAREGEAWTKDYVLSRLSDAKNPLKIPGIAFEATAGGLSKIAQRVHEAGRLVLDEAFTNLVNAGLVRNGPTDRREFVNRLGQYAGRAMDRVTEMARDLGIQPFVVAKKKSLAEIGRKVTFSPGTAAASKGKALEMRVGQLMKWLSFAAASGMVNYAYTGSVTGRPGTPLGNIDTGSNDPKTGVPQSWPWFGDVTGFGPALRASGAAGFFKAKQEGLTDAQAAGDAAMGPMNAVVLKWLSSPTTDFFSRWIKGQTLPQALGGGGGPKALPAEPNKNAGGSNLGFALREGAQLGGVATALVDKITGSKITPEYEQDATGEFFDLLKSFAPKRGTDPELLKDMLAIRNAKSAAEWAEGAVRLRRNFPSTDAWWAWVEKEVAKENWPERERYHTLQTLSRKRGK